jgi:hypothetical protein
VEVAFEIAGYQAKLDSEPSRRTPVLSFRHLAWFQPGNFGRLPVPNRWPGWVVSALFVVIIASTVRLTGELAWAVRTAVAAGYFAIAYATLSLD